MEALDSLLKPSWGAEKWILEGWNKINSDERTIIKNRVDDLFKDGLPFEIKHDKLLYIYTFSLMAQLEVLGIQLPMRFEDQMQKPEFKQRLRAQLVDEIFHAIVFTKIVFLLCEPYGSPPAYNERIETICNFVRSQDCLKVGMVVMNLVCEGLVEEVFTIYYKHNFAPKVFEIIMEDEHRHVCEADLYGEIGLPERTVLEETLQELEELLISAFSMEPKYTVALSAILGPQGVANFIVALQDKHIRQLKKINMTPSKKWDLLFQLGSTAYPEYEQNSDELYNEVNLEIYEVEMTPIKKLLMTQLNSPGDPTIVAQFNIDLSGLGFFENKYSNETLTILMLQAVSRMLKSEDSFRSFLSYKKLYQSRGAYVSVAEKLPNCGDHVGTINFRDCHEISTQELQKKIQRAVQLMTYCYRKREQIEKENPLVKQRLDAVLYDSAHNLYPCPVPGNPNVFLTNLGAYGYTQAVSPLLKQTGLHILLLAIERKQVWSNTTQTFEVKDLLPVSISADGRIFDGILPIPELLNKAFQTAFQQMEQIGEPLAKETPESNDYRKKIDEIADKILAKGEKLGREQIISHLFHKNKSLEEVKRIFGEDLEIYGEKITSKSDFKNIADKLLVDYLKFNAEDAAKDANFTKIVDKMLTEDLELGYRVLTSLQTAWLDYVDIEALFDAASKKIANSWLNKLAKFMPTITYSDTQRWL